MQNAKSRHDGAQNQLGINRHFQSNILMIQKLLSLEHFETQIHERPVFAAEIYYPFSPQSYNPNVPPPTYFIQKWTSYFGYKTTHKNLLVYVESQEGHVIYTVYVSLKYQHVPGLGVRQLS